MMKTVSRTISRRDFVKLAVLSLTASSTHQLVGCSSSSPMQLAVQPWSGYEFLMLSEQKGWLDNKRVKLLHTGSTRESFSALRDGKVDGAALTLDEVLRLREQGLDIQVVMIFDVSVGADVVLTRPDIDSLDALSGKRIGVEQSSLGSIMLYKILQLTKFDETSLIIVPISEKHVNEWESQNLDAIITYEPSRSILEEKGLVPLLDSRSLPLLVVDVLAVRREAAKGNPRGVTAAISGHFYALHNWRSNPVGMAYHLADRLEVTAQNVPEVYKGLDLPDLHANRSYLTPPAKRLYTSANDLAAIMMEAGLLKSVPDLDDLFTVDYLPASIR